MTHPQVDNLINEIRNISHGNSEPMGLEALVMSISGPGKPGHYPLCSAISEPLLEISKSIDAHTQQMERIAACLEQFVSRTT